MNDLRNRVVWITGGTRGIGKAIALRLARTGAAIAICGRREDSLRDASNELKQLNPNVLGVKVDISNSKDIEACERQIRDTFGPVDILINNAGVYRYASLLETTPEMWDTQFDINLKGSFLATRAVVPSMIERRSGTIVFISSTIAVISPPLNSCYTATKWGLEGFAGCLGQELVDAGIKVHVLRPGFTDTSIFDEIGKPDLEIDWIDPDEIAQAVEFLLHLPKHAQVPELTYMTTFQRRTY